METPLGRGTPGVAPLDTHLARQTLVGCILDAALDVLGGEEAVKL